MFFSRLVRAGFAGRFLVKINGRISRGLETVTGGFRFIWRVGGCSVGLVWLSAQAALPIEMNFASQLETLSGPGWRAEAVDFRIAHQVGQTGTLTVSAERLTVSGLPTPLENISLHCGALTLDRQEMRCAKGTLHIAKFQGRSVEGQLRFSHLSGDKKTELVISDLSLAAGRVDLSFQLNNQAWQGQLRANRLKMNLLESWLNAAVPGLTLAKGQNRGLVNINAEVSGSAETLQTGQLQIQSPKLSVATSSGRYATENLVFRFKGQWQKAGRFNGELRVSNGQVYGEPVFLQIKTPQTPLIVKVTGRFKHPLLILDKMFFNHPGVVQAEASGRVRWGEEYQLEKAQLTLNEAIFPTVYTTYLQPFSADGALGQLQTQGQLQGYVAIADSTLQGLRLKVTKLYLEDALNRFGFKGLNGALVWNPDPKPQRSQLSWDEGNMYELSLGAGKLPFESTQGTLRLRKESRIPILDGALMITQMEAKGVTGEPLQWRFDGFLTPLSMASLSQALGWPPLAGKLSGMMPDVRYDNGRLAVGGSLLVRIFGGDITITDLRIDDLFGPVPKAFANVNLRALDLETLTQTFDFGRIQGKLNGHIEDLRLIDWQPVHFDAVFATPEDDRSQRRISQQAVQNLSALSGGNPTAVLSRGFLSLFKAFRYKRLGLRCRLNQGVCTMNGVSPAGAGYYLVEGEGLPRIDVIGYNRRVDWDELVERLQTAIQSGRPIVE